MTEALVIPEHIRESLWEAVREKPPYFVPVPNEPIIDHPTRGKWEYVREVSTGKHLYLHMTCDCACDDTGHCMMCGAPCPTIWTVVKER
jgi:hypothetical protein